MVLNLIKKSIRSYFSFGLFMDKSKHFFFWITNNILFYLLAIFRIRTEKGTLITKTDKTMKKYNTVAD